MESNASMSSVYYLPGTSAYVRKSVDKSDFLNLPCQRIHIKTGAKPCLPRTQNPYPYTPPDPAFITIEFVMQSNFRKFPIKTSPCKIRIKFNSLRIIHHQIQSKYHSKGWFGRHFVNALIPLRMASRVTPRMLHTIRQPL